MSTVWPSPEAPVYHAEDVRGRSGDQLLVQEYTASQLVWLPYNVSPMLMLCYAARRNR